MTKYSKHITETEQRECRARCPECGWEIEQGDAAFRVKDFGALACSEKCASKWLKSL